MKLIILFSFFLFSNLYSLEFIYNNIKEYKINLNEVQYMIEAKEKKVDYDKLKKFRFFNKEKIIQNASFYTEGKFSKQNISISFDKAYFLEGMFIMYGIKADLIDKKIEGKKAVFFNNQILFDKIYLYQNNRKMRKIKYQYSFNL